MELWLKYFVAFLVAQKMSQVASATETEHAKSRNLHLHASITLHAHHDSHSRSSCWVLTCNGTYSLLSLTHSLTHIPSLPPSLPLSTYTRSHLNRVDSQWQKRATDAALSAASKVTEQLNYFLVAHLKSVPLDKLSNKISQTFATIDLDGSGEINTYEV